MKGYFTMTMLSPAGMTVYQKLRATPPVGIISSLQSVPEGFIDSILERCSLVECSNIFQHHAKVPLGDARRVPGDMRR